MKSRETLQIIVDANVEVEVIEYLKTPPSRVELKELLSKLGMNPSEIVRKSEPAYKENFKGKTLTQDQWLDALIDYPKLIERPIVVKGNKAILGRPPENVNSLI